MINLSKGQTIDLTKKDKREPQQVQTVIHNL